MKTSKKLIKEINELLNPNYFTNSQIRTIKTYTDQHRLFILMLSPFIPLSIRQRAIQLYKQFINPACTMPFSLVNSFILTFDPTLEDYTKTLSDIIESKLNIY